MQPRLIIFDFDGTLADTTATILRTYHRTIDELHADNRNDAELRATIGFPLKEGFRHLYPEYSDVRLDECVVTYRRIFNEHKKELVPQLFPGVKETLDKLAKAGIALTIASSRSRESLIEFCEATGIAKYFSLILGANDVVRSKPDPAPVLQTLAELRCKADECIVVGDMPVDIAMGRGAGCHCVGVSYGNSSRSGLTAAGADIVIDTMAELPPYCGEI